MMKKPPILSRFKAKVASSRRKTGAECYQIHSGWTEGWNSTISDDRAVTPLANLWRSQLASTQQAPRQRCALADSNQSACNHEARRCAQSHDDQSQAGV
jgi:hypothetical protein